MDKKGGAFLGVGSFGIVFADPRVPCKSETIDNIPSNQVSKLFTANALESAKEEASVRQRLEENGWTEEELNEFRRYAIIPSELCKVKNVAESDGKMWYNSSPYNERQWLTDKSSGQYVEGINIRKIPREYPYMIISEQGENDLKEEFNKITTESELYNAVIRLDNIIKGCDMLLNNNFVHPDLKDKNCIRVDSDYKMIDLADVRNYIVPTNWDPQTNGFLYYAFPSTNVWMKIFYKLLQRNVELKRIRGGFSKSQFEKDKKSIFTSNNIEVMKNNSYTYFRNEQTARSTIKEMYIQAKHFNDDHFKYGVISIIDAFQLTTEDGFMNDDIKGIKDLRNAYFNERTFGIIDKIEDGDPEGYVHKLKRVLSNRSIKNADYSAQHNNVLRVMNEYFMSLLDTDPELFVHDLFARLEWHSVGFMMLQMIKSFLRNLREERSELLRNTPRLRKNIIILHYIASKFYLQNNNITINASEMSFTPKNNNELVQLYSQFVRIIRETFVNLDN